MTDSRWLTADAIALRIHYLSSDFSFRTYNGALQIMAADKVEGGDAKWWFRTVQDDRVCDDCAGYEGRVYSTGVFTPMLPRHFGCRCSLELVGIDILPDVDVFMP